jgi:transposase
MTREEAILIAHSDPETIVEVLLKLSQEIEELKRQVALLTRDSSNSSFPPSSDGPKTKLKPKPKKKSKKRRPGGQPGHKGANRKLVPVEEVDKIVTVSPSSCSACGASLTPGIDGSAQNDKYLRFQVTDIPEPKPEVTEYQLQCVRCSCGKETWAELPAHARSGFGPRITAILSHLAAIHRVTRRGCQEIAKTVFGVEICLGSVCNLHEEVSRSVKQPCEEIRRALPKQPVLNVDETGWKTCGKTRWIWVFTTPVLAFFHIAASRGSKVLKEVLGEVFNGSLGSDMYSAYKAYHKGVRQFCWAHIIRTVKGVKHACRSPDAVKFSKWMLSETGRMFALWHAFMDERLDRKSLVHKSVPIRARMNKCLQYYRTSEDYDVRKTAKSLLKHWDGLFTFLEYEGVEPTNNLAERALRPAVQWRKICFGNQSQEGEILTARLLTITRTCKLQQKNALDMLVDSIVAYRNGLTAPSLV